MEYKNGQDLPSRCECYRTANGWTVEELSQRANVPAHIIEIMEGGGRVPPSFNFRVGLALGFTDDRRMWLPAGSDYAGLCVEISG